MSETIPSGIEDVTTIMPWTVIRRDTWKGVNPMVGSHAEITTWRKPTPRKIGARERMRKFALLGPPGGVCEEVGIELSANAHCRFNGVIVL